jgi:hypothetical protein
MPGILPTMRATASARGAALRTAASVIRDHQLFLAGLDPERFAPMSPGSIPSIAASVSSDSRHSRQLAGWAGVHRSRAA